MRFGRSNKIIIKYCVAVMSRDIFLITCPGNCATTWLSRVLSNHPQIYCSHALSHHKDSQNLIQRVRDLHHYQQMPFYSAVTDLAKEHVDKKYIGNAHGYKIATLIANVMKFPHAGNIRIVNMMRHPITWIASTHGNYIKQSKFSTFSLGDILAKFNSDYVFFQEQASKHQCDPMDWNFILFCAACVRLNEIKNDFVTIEKHNMQNIQHYKMEETTTDAEVLKRLIKSITSDEILIGDAYIEQVYAEGKVNKHRSKTLSIEEQYNDWYEWQRDIFNLYMNKLSLHEHYRKLSYDISILEPNMV